MLQEITKKCHTTQTLEFERWLYKFVSYNIPSSCLFALFFVFCCVTVKTIYRTETLYSWYTHDMSCHCYSWYVHCDISIATSWVPGPLNSKGQNQGFLLSWSIICSLLIQWVCVNMDVTQHNNKKVHKTMKQQIKHFSFWEGRGLKMSMLLWWHHNHNL